MLHVEIARKCEGSRWPWLQTSIIEGSREIQANCESRPELSNEAVDPSQRLIFFKTCWMALLLTSDLVGNGTRSSNQRPIHKNKSTKNTFPRLPDPPKPPQTLYFPQYVNLLIQYIHDSSSYCHKHKKSSKNTINLLFCPFSYGLLP